MLEEAAAAGRAVGAFTCYDLLGFEAVVRAAESRAAPVIALIGARVVRRDAAASACSPRSAPRPTRAQVPVLIQLDHAADRELIARAAAAASTP